MTPTSTAPTPQPQPADAPRALFAGSFNPFTVGHLSVVERALPVFTGGIVIAVGVNAAKAAADPTALASRLDAIRHAVRHLPQVEVVSYSGLTVDAAVRHHATALLRGVRSVGDFEYERAMADVNRNLSGIETVLLYALPEHASVSSSVVRELEAYGRDVSQFLPHQHRQ